MISQVDICNQALNHLGKATIVSIDEASESARRCKLVYETCRDSALRAAPWGFATKIEPLAEISGEPVLGWDYLYKYPSKCLYLRKVMNAATLLDPKPQEFKQVLSPATGQKAVAAKIPQAYGEYTVAVTDTNLFDTSYVKALSYLIAGELAQPLTGDPSLRKSMLDLYQILVDDAQRTNASEGVVKAEKTSSYLDAR